MKLRNLFCSRSSVRSRFPSWPATDRQGRQMESTVQMEMPGMPMKMPPHTMTVCVTKEQAENAENLIPKTGDKRGGCTYTTSKSKAAPSRGR